MKDEVDLLILGLGNVLYSDDGLGALSVHLVEQQYEIPDGVRVADGGTLGLLLLPLFQQARRIVMVDAIHYPGLVPGELVRLESDEVAPVVQNRLSPHQVGVADLLNGARVLGEMPDELILLGLVPESLAFDVGLSAVVDRQMPALVRRVIAEAERMGHVLRPKAPEGAPSRPQGGHDVAAAVFGLSR